MGVKNYEICKDVGIPSLLYRFLIPPKAGRQVRNDGEFSRDDLLLKLLSVYVFTVGDFDDGDGFSFVVDLIDDSVLAKSITVSRNTFHLDRLWWSRVLGE